MVNIFFKIGQIGKRGVMFVMDSVFITFSCAWYILPIILAAPSVSGAVDAPSFIKPPLTETREMMPKFGDSRFKSGELCFKNVNDPYFVGRPLSWRRVEAKQFIKDGSAKSSASSNFPVPLKRP